MILHDDPELYGGAQQGMVTPQKRAMVETVARVPLTSMGNGNLAQVKFNKNSYSRNELITTTVEYPYLCRVPVGRTMACGFDGERSITAQASLPNHGADFIY